MKYRWGIVISRFNAATGPLLWVGGLVHCEAEILSQTITSHCHYPDINIVNNQHATRKAG